MAAVFPRNFWPSCRRGNRFPGFCCWAGILPSGVVPQEDHGCYVEEGPAIGASSDFPRRTMNFPNSGAGADIADARLPASNFCPT